MQCDSYRRERPANTTEQSPIENFEKSKYMAIQSVQHSTVDIFLIVQVLEYCEHHKGEPISTIHGTHYEISEWDQKFLAVDPEMLIEIVVAANNLDIRRLR
jgi:hypothetical protein